MTNTNRPSNLSLRLIGGGVGIILAGLVCVYLPKLKPELFASELMQNVLAIVFLIAFLGGLTGIVTVCIVLAPFIRLPKIKRLEVKGVKIEFDDKGNADVTTRE